MTAMHLIFTTIIVLVTCSCASWHRNTPIGSVTAYAGNYESIPEEWLPCDGRVLLKKEYDELSAILGGLHGANDSEFRIPDLRGRFIRGIDSSFVGSDMSLRLITSNNDPDRHSTRFVTDTTGEWYQNQARQRNSIGSVQDHAMAKHTHSTSISAVCIGGGGQTGNDFARAGCTIPYSSMESTPTGGSETRPVNMALIYIIRVR